MKKTILLYLAVALVACNNMGKKGDTRGAADKDLTTTKEETVMMDEQSSNVEAFYSLTTTTLDGEEFNFEDLKGKRILIVNTASECGFTPQYAQLQEVYEAYKDKGFVILGFPSNEFGGQEPGSNAEIGAFCQKNYGVSFPIMEKSDVLGNNKNEVYKWLTSIEANGKQDVTVSWNFNKFLVDENGQWVAHYPSNVTPLDERIIAFAEGR